MTDGERANLPKSFHDDALNITYFYPAHFTPDPPVTTDSVKCQQTNLTAWSHIASGLSSFVVSTMDANCPGGLPGVRSLGVYVRRQLLAELKPRGDAEIMQEPSRYFIDSHPAVVTLATVTVRKPNSKTTETTYAAKACAFGDIRIMRRRKPEPIDPVGRLLCFGFTTQNSDLLDMMFSFTVQFGDDPPEPLFPASVRPRY
jgi:hypothetical protein